MTPALALLITFSQLTVPQAAQIEVELAQAQRAVDAKYGNKKPSELTAEETREKIGEHAGADITVLEQHGLEAKEWARLQLKRDRITAAAVKAAVKALAASEDAGSPKADAEQPIEVQRGFTEANPFVLEQGSNSETVVETGLPPDVVADEEAAQARDEALHKETKQKKPARRKR